MTELGYKPYKTVSVGEDLLYKYSKFWNFTKISNEEDVDSILFSIMKEDVGVEIDDFNLNNTDQFTDLRRSLKDLLNNKKRVKKTFAEKVKNFGPIECTGRSVGMMLKKSLETLIPRDLLGGKQNKNRYILTLVKTLMFGKKDALPIKMFMYGIQFKYIRWFGNFGNPSFKLKTNFTAKLLLWLWRISKKLVASQFYVSEVQGCYNKLTFVCKNVWQRITDRAFKSLISCGSFRYLDREEAEKMLACRQQAKLRWLPKDIGLRPIISIRNDKLNMDTICARVLLNSILKFMGKDLILGKLQEKWKEVVELRTSLKLQQQYFVAVDIKDAYGSVIQDKLVDIVKQTVTRHLGNAGLVHFDTGVYRRRRIVICRELHCGTHYHILSTQILSIEYLLNFIKNVITCQTVKWDNKTHLMSRGISQAVSLSAALCKLYLAHLDETHLSEFTVEKGDLLLRAVDDFLYITSEKSKAQMFLDKMYQGFSDYGIFINKTKTQSNLSSHTEIEYYGFLFNTNNLEVYVKYVQSDNVSFKNMITFNKWEDNQQGYMILKHKIKMISSYKLNRLTTDPSYMTAKGLARNVFETACFMACCYKTIVHTMYQDIDPVQLMDVINYCAAIVALKVDVNKENPCLLSRETYWIVMRAFRMCMSINSTPDNKGFPECILPYLENQEEIAKIKTRLQVRTSIYEIVDKLPLQYRKGH